jgi:hypothetical protein
MNNWIKDNEKHNPDLSHVVLLTDGVSVSAGFLVEVNGELEWRYIGCDDEHHPNELHGDVTHWMHLPKPPNTTRPS